mmetsp:Transcript_32401/g.82659  ORF Transcript_32401/g.82659 Transcript_32401/m.82659 type:complete len:255 (+) Transcript_32401:175-939(+)
MALAPPYGGRGADDTDTLVTLTLSALPPAEGDSATIALKDACTADVSPRAVSSADEEAPGSILTSMEMRVRLPPGTTEVIIRAPSATPRVALMFACSLLSAKSPTPMPRTQYVAEKTVGAVKFSGASVGPTGSGQQTANSGGSTTHDTDRGTPAESRAEVTSPLDTAKITRCRSALRATGVGVLSSKKTSMGTVKAPSGLELLDAPTKTSVNPVPNSDASVLTNTLRCVPVAKSGRPERRRRPVTTFFVVSREQ